MIANVRQYRGARDSGVSWLGEVPDHWHVMPGRACYRERCIPNIGMRESQVLSLSFGRIVVKPKDKLHGLVPESFETYQIIEPGDIVVRPTDLQNDWNSLRFALSPHRGIITSAYICLRTQGEMTREYGYLLLHAYDLKKIFYGLGSGLRQNLDWRDFKYLPCLVPPAAEQSAIVRFLDHADRRIGRAIRAKQKLIALLNEQKQAVIHQAVTRGLDPNVRLKPSGVDWIGPVPEHWDVLRVKNVLRVVDERSTTGVETLLSLRREHGVVVFADHFSRPPQAVTTVGYKLVAPSQIVVNRLQANNGLIFSSPVPGLISPDYSVLSVVRDANPEYVGALLRMPHYRAHFRRSARGLGTGTAGFLRLYDDELLATPIALPPRHEQDKIMASLEDASAEEADAISAAERTVNLFREYRTRLTADVVTGKLDVREAAARLPDEVDEPEPLDEIVHEQSDEAQLDELEPVEA
jgi:type I restriction enzyme, S subunit